MQALTWVRQFRIPDLGSPQEALLSAAGAGLAPTPLGHSAESHPGRLLLSQI